MTVKPVVPKTLVFGTKLLRNTKNAGYKLAIRSKIRFTIKVSKLHVSVEF
jgi:hypothetical protein